MRTILLTLSAVALSILSSAVPYTLAETEILSFDQVGAGMKGAGKTVFKGTEVTEFQVEILGTLAKIAPDQNMILARLSGGPLSETGVLAGMSGSPVYIDGKLVGAVAYAWGFSKDAIAGITPIEEMLPISELMNRSGGPRRLSHESGIDLNTLLAAPALREFFRSRVRALPPAPGAWSPLTVPLSITGIGHAGLAGMTPSLRSFGFLPMQGGASGGEGPPTDLQAGSAVGIKLVRGDIEMTATGTVTLVDGESVIAFGHPMFGLGDIDLPMTAARVEALLPSVNISSRLTSTLREVGALRQDRRTGIAGRKGDTAAMIPVRLQYTDAGGRKRVYAFDIADDPLLAPVLLYHSLNGILSSRDRGFGNATISLQEGSVIKLQDAEDIELDNLFAGTNAQYFATGTGAYILHLLMNNVWSPPRIAGVNLLMQYEDMPRTARIQRVVLDRYRVRPGETINAEILLKPYRGPETVLTAELVIPAETPPGTIDIQVGSALAVSRAESTQEPWFPSDLDQFIRLINRLRRNDRIYLTASRQDDAVILDGVSLPGLPPSAACMLSRPKSKGEIVLVPQLSILEVTVPAPYMVQGMSRIQIEVEAS